jgi:hypothetical protein
MSGSVSAGYVGKFRRFRDAAVTRADILKLIGAVAGLALVVALISPPTRPVPTPAGDWRKQLPVKTGTPPPAASTVPVPAAALTRRPPPVQPQTAAETPPAIDQPPRPAPGIYRDDRPPPDDLAARRFRQGYHWAERNGIDDERDCFRQPGDPFTDGCLAALTNDDRSFGYAPDRRYRWGR